MYIDTIKCFWFLKKIVASKNASFAYPFIFHYTYHANLFWQQEDIVFRACENVIINSFSVVSWYFLVGVLLFQCFVSRKKLYYTRKTIFYCRHIGFRMLYLIEFFLHTNSVNEFSSAISEMSTWSYSLFIKIFVQYPRKAFFCCCRFQ